LANCKSQQFVAAITFFAMIRLQVTACQLKLPFIRWILCPQSKSHTLGAMQQSKLHFAAPSARGFTLIELMVVVAISAILTALAMPSMRQFIGNWQVSNAVNAYSGSLQLARAEAVKRGRVARVCRSSDGTTCATDGPTKGWATGWLVYVDNDASGGLTAPDQVMLTQGAINNFYSISSTVSGSTATVSTTTFVFTPTGLLQGGAAAQAMVFRWDSGATIQKTLCINKTGRSRVVKDLSTCTGSGY
jgi:type IV fimbrial biogenesis protein FimT